MGPVAARSKDPPYRITMAGKAWHVARPHAAMVHAFDDLDDAVAFVCRDSDGTQTVVEIVSGTLYMLKPIRPMR